MEIMICEKGHRYDPTKHSSCPKCAESNGMYGGGNTGEFESVNVFDPGAGIPSEDFTGGGAMPPTGYVNGGGAMPPTVGYVDGGAMPPTVGYVDGSAQGAQRGYSGDIGLDETRHAFGDDEGYTQVLSKYGTTGFNPVAGWFVCIEGADKGADYKIKDGYNYIGRSEHMDICIRNDSTISRDKHALIAYDKKSKTFFVGPADGRNLIYLNDNLVMSPQIINMYDKLTIGNTTLMFIPLCGKEFDWND